MIIQERFQRGRKFVGLETVDSKCKDLEGNVKKMHRQRARPHLPVSLAEHQVWEKMHPLFEGLASLGIMGAN